jgi:hypothetical protein
MVLSPINGPGEGWTGGSESGDLTELFLKKFSGEVAEFYQAETKLLSRVRTKTIAGGKSYTFGATGDATAAYHLRGVRAIDDLDQTQFGERLIKLDRPISNFQFIDEWEEMVNHFDVRGPIASAMGQAVGVLAEKQGFRTLFRGSEATADVAGQALGLQQTIANAGTSAADFLSGLEAQIQDWNEKNVPMAGRFCFVTPAVWNLLVDLTDFQSVDLGNGGNGSLKSNDVGMIKGVEIIMTSILPQDDYTTAPSYTASGMNNDYRCDMEFCVGVFGTARAIGQVTLKGLQVVSQPEPLDSGTYLKTSKACGFGVLRESDCGSIITQAD